MRPLWPSVRNALASFARAIPDGDELDVWAFSGDARRLISPAPASADVRRSWERTFATLPEPRGASTDLGLAARKGIDALGGMNADRIGYLVVITDGQHQPGPSSSFPAANGPAWNQLASDARALVRARPVTIALIRVSAEADLGVLQAVLPTPVLQDALGSRDLEAWFVSLGREIAREKLLTLIRKDLANPAANIRLGSPVKVHAGAVSQLVSDSTQLRRIVRTVLLDSNEISLGKDGALWPRGDALKEPATLRMIGPARPLWQWPSADAVSVDRTVIIRTRLEPADELARLGVGRVSDVDSIHVAVVISPRGRLGDAQYYATVGGLVLLLGVVGVRSKRAMHRPSLRGTLLITPKEPGSATTRLGLAEVAGRRIEVPAAATDGPALAIEARNVRGRTSLFATPLQRDITADGKPVAGEVQLNGRKRFSTSHHDIEYQP